MKCRIAVVAPRKMRFSPVNATSIDLHIHETVRWSDYRDNITVFAEEIEAPFSDLSTRFWPKGARTRKIVETIQETDPTLIVVHQHLPTASALARAHKNIPVALVRHNFMKPARNSLSRFMKRRKFNRLAALGFVSECCRDDFATNWPEVRTPLEVVLNGIDGALWKNDQAKDPLVLFVGRIAPEKGMLEAVKALRSVLNGDEDSRNWRGMFIGATAPEHADYARTVTTEINKSQGKITLETDLRHEEVRHWMEKASIVLAPTQHTEPFGRVAIEAMACGAVPIATARGGFVEIIGDAGVLLETPDATSIAKAIGHLIQDDESRMRLSMAARDRVIPRYNLSTTAATFDSFVRPFLRETS